MDIKKKEFYNKDEHENIKIIRKIQHNRQF